MCERCDLTRCDLAPSTIERYQKAGGLMLRSDVVACLLPSFVWVIEDAVEALLDDEEAARRLNDAFNAKLKSYFVELRDSRVLQGKKPILELDGTMTPLELDAQSMLLESGTTGQDSGGSLMVPLSPGVAEDNRRKGKRRK